LCEGVREFLKGRVIPIVRFGSFEDALFACRVLVEASFPVIEVTFTVPNAEGLMKKIYDEFGEQLLLGAGTVLEVEQVRLAYEAGAKFIVSPVTDLEVIAEGVGLGILTIPGALTASEVSLALKAGCRLIKIFPAGAFGPSYIKGLAAIFPEADFIPTGGIGLEDIKAFFSAGAYAIGMGSKLLDKEAVRKREKERLLENLRKAAHLRDGGG